jgi:hypothetical protein
VREVIDAWPPAEKRPSPIYRCNDLREIAGPAAAAFTGVEQFVNYVAADVTGTAFFQYRHRQRLRWTFRNGLSIKR